MNAIKTTTTEIILNEEYGAGLGIYEPASILWAAGAAADKIGVAAAKEELKTINGLRAKIGVPVAVPAYGDRLF